MFWWNKRKIDFSWVSSDSRHSQKVALKQYYYYLYFFFFLLAFYIYIYIFLSPSSFLYFSYKNRQAKQNKTAVPPPPSSSLDLARSYTVLTYGTYICMTKDIWFLLIVSLCVFVCARFLHWSWLIHNLLLTGMSRN